MSKSKTKKEHAAEDAARSIKHLKIWLAQQPKNSSQTKAAKALLEELEWCHEDLDYHCRSLACRHCRQRYHTRLPKKLKRHIPQVGELCLVTLIPEDGWVPPGGLHGFDLEKFRKRHAKALKATFNDRPYLLGGVDLSLNSFNNSDFWWQVHLHILVVDVTAVHKRKLAKRYKDFEELSIYRAVHTTSSPWKGFNKEIRYLHKAYFLKRSGFLANPKSRTRNPYRDAKGQQLPGWADVELMLALSDHTVGDLLLLKGLKPIRSNFPGENGFQSTFDVGG